MINTIVRLLIMGSLAALTACSSDSSSDSNTSGVGLSDPVNCNSPCLLEAPTLDINTISAATGGIVNVTFTIKGDLATVAQIQIDVLPVDSSNGQGRVTFVTIQDPAQATNTQPMVINAGSIASGEYYLKFNILSTVTNEFGDVTDATYDLIPVISTTNYSFQQTIVGEAQTEVITDLVIPFITINP